MKKKLITAAVGAAIVAVAGVAQADVKVSGYGNLSLDQIKGCKTAACTTAGGNSNALNVSSNSSYLKFDAAEDLGGGLKAIFSLTEYVRADNNASGAQVSGGNTIGGLAGEFGVVALGAHDTGGKLNGRSFDLFGNQVGDSRNADVNNNRASNVVAYLSPNWSGFSFVIGHSTNVAVALPAGGLSSPNNGLPASAVANTQVATPTIQAQAEPGAANKDSVTADTALLSFVQGPLTIGVGYDKTKFGDALSASTLTAPKWTNAGVKYAFPTGTDVAVFYQKHDAWDLVSGDNTKVMGVGAKQTFGNNAVKAQYYQTKWDSAAGVDCDKTKLLALGFDHAFSKTTTGYVAYAEMKNSNKSSCMTALSAAGGGHGDNPGTVAGEKSSAISVGMTFVF